MRDAPTSSSPSTADLSSRLVQILGPDNVLTDPADLEFFSHDIDDRGELVELVIRPGTVEEVSRAVAMCTENGRVVIPRGGGLSHTAGYRAVRSQSGVVDLRRLDRLMEINAQAMYVTV